METGDAASLPESESADASADQAWLATLREDLLRRARIWVRAAEAEDMAQEAIRRLLHAYPGLVGLEGGRAQAFKVLRNLCVDEARERSQHPVVGLGEVAEPSGWTVDPASDSEVGRRIVVERGAMAMLWRTLRGLLGKGERRVLRCLRRGRTRNGEIAKKLGITIQAVGKARAGLNRKEALSRQIIEKQRVGRQQS